MIYFKSTSIYTKNDDQKAALKNFILKYNENWGDSNLRLYRFTIVDQCLFMYEINKKTTGTCLPESMRID